MNKYWLFALVLILPFAFAFLAELSSWQFSIFLETILGYSDLLILAITYEFVKGIEKKKPKEKKILKYLMIVSVVLHVIMFAVGIYFAFLTISIIS